MEGLGRERGAGKDVREPAIKVGVGGEVGGGVGAKAAEEGSGREASVSGVDSRVTRYTSHHSMVTGRPGACNTVHLPLGTVVVKGDLSWLDTSALCASGKPWLHASPLRTCGEASACRSPVWSHERATYLRCTIADVP